MNKPKFSKLSTGLCKSQQGFTLIEIMIALMIAAVAVVAIIDAMGKNTQVSSELEQRILASWVASNQIAEMRYDSKINRIKEGSRSKTIKMGGLKWRVKSRVKKTDVERVYLVTVEVQDAVRRNENPFATMTTALTNVL